MSEERIVFRVSKELKYKVEAKAKELGLTVSGYIKMILTKDTKKQ